MNLLEVLGDSLEGLMDFQEDLLVFLEALLVFPSPNPHAMFVSNLLHFHAIVFFLFLSCFSSFGRSNNRKLPLFHLLLFVFCSVCRCVTNSLCSRVNHGEEFEFVQGATQLAKRERAHEAIAVDVAADG
jgi:hypothetical protein